MSFEEMKEKDSLLKDTQSVKVMFSFEPISLADYVDSEGVKYGNSPVFKYKFNFHLVLNNGTEEKTINDIYGKDVIFQMCCKLNSSSNILTEGNLIKLSATKPDQWKSQNTNNNWTSLINK